MKKINLKNLKKKLVVALTSLVACLILGANAYPVVACAEEAPENVVTIETTIKEKDNDRVELMNDEKTAEDKITAPDESLVEDFEKTLEIAEGVLLPKIYLIVASIIMVALIILAYAMLFVAV